MSLYCFGKLKLITTNQDAFAFRSGVVVRGDIDPSDGEEIEKFEKLTGDGVYFAIVDRSDVVDATGLWNDMLGAIMKDPGGNLETNLGRTVHELLFHPEISAVGLHLSMEESKLCWKVHPSNVGIGFWNELASRGIPLTTRC